VLLHAAFVVADWVLVVYFAVRVFIRHSMHI